MDATVVATQVGTRHRCLCLVEPGGIAGLMRLGKVTKRRARVLEHHVFADAPIECRASEGVCHQAAEQICDRFIDSTRVYQGVVGHGDPAFIKRIEQATVEPIVPKLTLVLDVPAEAGLARACARGEMNRYDQKDMAWHHALRTAFQDAAKSEPHRCVAIDGNRDERSVAGDVWRAVEARVLAGLP